MTTRKSFSVISNLKSLPFVAEMSNFTVFNFKVGIITAEEEKLENVFKDAFEDVFENKYLCLGMAGLYLVGISSCGMLVLASWFERSGQAGPYRTLLNRLGTLNVEQVSKLTS